jgi:hypothetical protein
VRVRRTDYGDYSRGGTFYLNHERYLFRRREMESIGLESSIMESEPMDRIAIGATPEAWRVLMNEMERQIEFRRASR